MAWRLVRQAHHERVGGLTMSGAGACDERYGGLAVERGGGRAIEWVDGPSMSGLVGRWREVAGKLALGAAPGEHAPTRGCLHARAKPVGSRSANSARLVGPLHDRPLSSAYAARAPRQRRKPLKEAQREEAVKRGHARLRAASEGPRHSVGRPSHQRKESAQLAALDKSFLLCCAALCYVQA